MSDKPAPTSQVNRIGLFTLCGVFLGVFAPIGWTMLRLTLFWVPGEPLWSQIVGDIVASSKSIALYLYMGGGTAVVLGAFGYFIGRASQQMHDRAASLDRLNADIARQKGEFERRFRDLNKSIKDFHSINTHIQKSVDRDEVLRLAADGLHNVLGYDRVNILMVNRPRKVMEFVASLGGKPLEAEVTLPLDDRAGALYKVVQENRLLLVDDIRKLGPEYHLKPPCNHLDQLRSRCFILCPIVVKDEVVGLFGIDNKDKRKQLDDTDVDTVKLFADQVASALTKINLLQAVESLIRELDHTFTELLKYREEHGRLDRSLNLATGSTSEAIREIAEAADVVRDAVNATRSAAGEIAVSVDQVSQNLKHLSDFMDNSISAVTEISATIKLVQENGARSHEMSEGVKVKAENGAQAVGNAQEGLQAIATAVDRTVATIDLLSQKSEEIDSITAVIAEITQKTNLLALNAAIIAAQAGEHGRSFGVVAEEVRSLSQQTAKSTGAIGKIIGEIQRATRESVDQVNQTRELVAQGIVLGQGVEGSLQQILESSAQAMEMAHHIRTATHEVARSVESVHRSIEELGEMSSQVSVASKEQVQGTRSIAQSIEEVKNMADDMVHATERQQRNTRDIENAVSSVSAMAAKIFSEMEARQASSKVVIENLERLKRV